MHERQGPSFETAPSYSTFILGLWAQARGAFGFLGCSLHSVQEYDECAAARNTSSFQEAVSEHSCTFLCSRSGTYAQ